MDAALSRLVWQRAKGRCEYCQMSQAADDDPFEIDHIIARTHSGPTVASNLCLSCLYWNFTKRRALYGRYHPTFRDFQAAIQEVLDGLSTKYSQQLASLMTLNFQQFDDVSLMAA